MKRRKFIAASCIAGLSSLQRSTTAKANPYGSRDYYELRTYTLETAKQKAGFDRFMKEACIPAMNRINIKPVGVFYPIKEDEISPAYVLLRHTSLDAVSTMVEQLGMDDEFMERGAAFLDAPAAKPAYKRVESSVMEAFSGMPSIETPIKSPGRILQLRIYESPSVKTGLKKIEMFNNGEIDIFRRTGLHPVFFGKTIAGAHMPNLTYMLVFNNMDERKKNWKQFVGHPDWKAISSIPDYADKKILCNIQNIFLRPAPYSQV